MLGRAHGNRSPLTCHLKCDSACAYPAPNASTEPTFAEIASRQLSRRSLLVATGALAAATGLPIFLGGCTPDQQRNSPDQRENPPFHPTALTSNRLSLCSTTSTP
jgi:hypothetical protein